MTWHTAVLGQLRASRLFTSVELTGGKVRARLSLTRFLDVHFDPVAHSYSYALVDLMLPYPGDKRLLGWDDFPHPGVDALAALPSHPHHFQIRQPDGRWQFSASPFQGQIEEEIPAVLAYLREYLARST